MADERLATSAELVRQLTHDDEDQQRINDPLTADEPADDVATNAARRRASLDKEIRAGWQRALGH